MAKEKKITIKHYLNKRVKPQSFQYNKSSNYEKRYSIYTQLTYNRQNNNLVLKWSNNIDSYGISQKEFDLLFNQRINKKFSDEIGRKENLIKDSIRYEAKKYGEKFTLKNFSSRLNYVYKKSISEILNELISKEILNLIEDKITVKQMGEIYRVSNKFPFEFSLDEESFGDYFWKILEYIPNIVKQLPKDLHCIISAYVHFLHFKNNEGILYKDEYLIPEKHLINWLDGKIKDGLLNFSSFDSGMELVPVIGLRDEIKAGFAHPIYNLENLTYNIFPINHYRYEKVLSSIDKAINKIMEFPIETFLVLEED